MMVELELINGDPIVVNPIHVISVMGHRHQAWEDYTGPASEIQLVNPANGWIIKGSPRDILDKLGSC